MLCQLLVFLFCGTLRVSEALWIDTVTDGLGLTGKDGSTSSATTEKGNAKIYVSSYCSSCYSVWAIDGYQDTRFSTKCSKEGAHWIVIKLQKAYTDLRVEVIPDPDYPDLSNHLHIALSNEDLEATLKDYAADIDFKQFKHTCHDHDLNGQGFKLTKKRKKRSSWSKSDVEYDVEEELDDLRQGQSRKKRFFGEVTDWLGKAKDKVWDKVQSHGKQTSKSLGDKVSGMISGHDKTWGIAKNYAMSHISGATEAFGSSAKNAISSFVGGSLVDDGTTGFFGGMLYCKNYYPMRYIAIMRHGCIGVSDINIYTGDAPEHCLQTDDPTGTRYRGYMYTTKDGVPCDSWEDPLHSKEEQSPYKKGPYCRNIGGKLMSGLWCWTKRSPLAKHEWGWCNYPPRCGSGFQYKLTIRECLDWDVDHKGMKYIGHHYYKKSFPTCIPWEFTTYKTTAGLLGPWCRNLGRSKKPWCVIPSGKPGSGSTTWQLCDVPNWCEK